MMGRDPVCITPNAGGSGTRYRDLDSDLGGWWLYRARQRRVREMTRCARCICDIICVSRACEAWVALSCTLGGGELLYCMAVEQQPASSTSMDSKAYASSSSMVGLNIDQVPWKSIWKCVGDHQNSPPEFSLTQVHSARS